MEKHKIAALEEELKHTFSKLKDNIQAISEEELNTIPKAGSWTAGQVIDHILRSAQGIDKIFYQDLAASQRPYDQHVGMIRKLFLDFSTRMQSPDPIVPGDGPFDKAEQLQKLDDTEHALLKALQLPDLTLICQSFELPGLGQLSRWELLNFYSTHIMRHTHQFKNVSAMLQGQAKEA